MKRDSRISRARQTPKTSNPALYEVVYVDQSVQRAPALPKQNAHIAYVRHFSQGRRYLVPRGSHWIEVNEESALQRAEGLRRADK
jgi:hypothetical protein